MKASILIPMYNEQETIQELVEKVLKVPIDKEIIIVDNNSKDFSLHLAKEMSYRNKEISVYTCNIQGKGAAIREALSHANGDVYIVQDADLEYDPMDYLSIMNEFENDAMVVYGSRIKGQKAFGNLKHSYFTFYLGGMVLTTIFNILNGTKISDEPTCYKCYHKNLRNELVWEGNGFEWEPEITTKIARLGYDIVEVPIHYYPRSKEEGKKINWKDGVKGIWALIKYRWKFRGNKWKK